MAGADVCGPFDAVAVVAGAFDDAGVTAVAAWWVEVLLAGYISVGFGEGGLQVLRGKRPPGR
jgi:hypothetical protein